MENDIYRKLQKHLDHMPVPFPATQSGVEIRLLKELFTREEACIVLALSAVPETAKRIYKRLPKTSISPGDLENKLDTLAKEGKIMRYRHPKSGSIVYHKIPLAIGIFEFQVDRIGEKFAKLFYAYEAEAFAREQFGMKTRQMRTIPLNINIEPYFAVSNYDNIKQIIEDSPGPFAIMNCVCRQAKDAIYEPCQHTRLRETCITLEEAATFMMERKVARELTKSELLKFLVTAKKEGLVLQPENIQHPTFICCCCGCCCGVLSMARKFSKPADLIHSNFFTQVSEEKCDGCEKCLERCQMDAISRFNGFVQIDHNRCIGCGVCIPVCEKKALRLVKKKTEYIPPANKKDMYKKMLVERYGYSGLLKIGLQAMAGRKI